MDSGPRGTRQTLRLMARLVRDAVRTQPAVRSTAADITAFIPGQAFREEARTLFEFVRDRIRYLGDVNGVETVQAPNVTLDVMHGDCDDKATLLAAMLESIGHPARFVAVGFHNPGEFEHVYVESRIGAEWVPMDTTMPVLMGWSPTDESHPVAMMRETI